MSNGVPSPMNPVQNQYIHMSPDNHPSPVIMASPHMSRNDAQHRLRHIQVVPSGADQWTIYPDQPQASPPRPPVNIQIQPTIQYQPVPSMTPKSDSVPLPPMQPMQQTVVQYQASPVLSRAGVVQGSGVVGLAGSPRGAGTSLTTIEEQEEDMEPPDTISPDKNQNQQIRVVFCSGDGKSRPMNFNRVHGESTPQETVFNECGVKELVLKALEGYSTTIFAYGQTGSGKTFTITGPENEIGNIQSTNSNSKSQPQQKQPLPAKGRNGPQGSLPGIPERAGIIPRALRYLFDQIRKRPGEKFVVRAAYLEIYNEQVQDLLNPSSTSLAVRWSPDRGFYVENLFVVECEVLDDCLAVLEEGVRNRRKGSHALNEHSSRSHSIMTVHIDGEYIDKSTTDEEPPPKPQSTPDQQKQMKKEKPTKGEEKMKGQGGGAGAGAGAGPGAGTGEARVVRRHGRISFVDLAGSEKVTESKASGGTFIETLNINKSLLTLGNCISALSDSKKRTGHIPYRDSKLTKLLSDSLGGHGIALMIACISPSTHCTSETLKTLRYAARALRITRRKTPVVRMEDPRELLIARLKKDLSEVKREREELKVALWGLEQRVGRGASAGGSVVAATNALGLDAVGAGPGQAQGMSKSDLNLPQKAIRQQSGSVSNPANLQQRSVPTQQQVQAGESPSGVPQEQYLNQTPQTIKMGARISMRRIPRQTLALSIGIHRRSLTLLSRFPLSCHLSRPSEHNMSTTIPETLTAPLNTNPVTITLIAQPGVHLSRSPTRTKLVIDVCPRTAEETAPRHGNPIITFTTAQWHPKAPKQANLRESLVSSVDTHIHTHPTTVTRPVRVPRLPLVRLRPHHLLVRTLMTTIPPMACRLDNKRSQPSEEQGGVNAVPVVLVPLKRTNR
ncbi:Kinesin- protein 12 [Quaeritorhiza haematococci]|nr:Kinesin- protein 12 [Quaeritorhiza haematococci]